MRARLTVSSGRLVADFVVETNPLGQMERELKTRRGFTNCRVDVETKSKKKEKNLPFGKRSPNT
jgi:hypothetical protein